MTKPANWYSIVAARGAKNAEVFIYGDIGESWDGETVAARQFIKDIAALDAENLSVRINSVGGSVPDGLAIFNALRRHKAKVAVSVDGLAASIASLIAMAGDSIHMAENAMLMIHAPWSVVGGNAKDMRERADMLDKWAEAMAVSYVREGGLTHDQALALLTDGADHWYGADEALAAGLVDEIVPAIPMAASINQTRFTPPVAAATFITKGSTMTEQVKQTPAAEPTPAIQAAAPAAAPSPAVAKLQKLEAEDIKAAALVEEHARRAEIRAVFSKFAAHAGVEAMMNQYLDNPQISIETARASLLEHVARNAEPLGGGLVMTTEDEYDKFKTAAKSGLLIRAGLTANDRSNEYRGYSLLELARASLHRMNVSTKGMDKMSVVAAAFTHSSSDFDNLLADVANKSMLKGYEEAEETFQKWTSAGTLPDFKAAKRVDLNTFPALPAVVEGGEYKYVTVGDRGETIQLATYGSLFSITRQAIINDDLDAFTRVPNKMGRAAIRTVGNLVYAVLTGNPAMSDGDTLFHANHSNLSTGVISSANVDALATLLARQKDTTGNTLNIEMAYLIVPRTLKGSALMIANSEFEVGTTVGTNRANTVPNIVRGAFEVIADARLDATSTAVHYAAANPNIHDTIEVAYLDGNQSPTLEQQGGWTVDGVEFKVRLDAGVKALDWRGLARTSGA
jgi:ATP-dependent protease ClpP protease subunit